MKCGKEFSPSLVIFECAECKGALDILYDYEKIKKQLIKSLFIREPITHWKYSMFYPINDFTKIITLNEGNTPLLPCTDKESGNFLFKYEATNPTGVFKDRGTSVEITKANELGIKNVACATTGNMGASVAAYCARAGMKAHIYVPYFAEKPKLLQMMNYGADIHMVKGTYDDAFRMVAGLRQSKNYYLTGDYAYRGEGQKSVGFEIIDQLEWEVPEYIVMPVGNGVLFSAVYKACKELKEVGLTKKMPKLVAVQAKGCNPITQAFKKHQQHVTTIKNPKTIASAIACGTPVDAEKVLEGLRKTRGFSVDVTDNEMISARKFLGKQGLFVEPSSATAFAGAIKSGLQNKAGRGADRVVCVLTGHGLKDPRVF